MTRYYTPSGKLLAVQFCGDKKATLWLGQAERAWLFESTEETIHSEYGTRFTKEEFISKLLRLPLASEEEMYRRFETLDLSYETDTTFSRAA